jgi:hypothetical protein
VCGVWHHSELIVVSLFRSASLQTFHPKDPFFTGFENTYYETSSSSLKGVTPTAEQEGFCDDGKRKRERNRFIFSSFFYELLFFFFFFFHLRLFRLGSNASSDGKICKD